MRPPTWFSSARISSKPPPSKMDALPHRPSIYSSNPSNKQTSPILLRNPSLQWTQRQTEELQTPTRKPHNSNLPPFRLQPLLQQPNLRRLATTIQSFQHNERASGHRGILCRRHAFSFPSLVTLRVFLFLLKDTIGNRIPRSDVWKAVCCKIFQGK